MAEREPLSHLEIMIGEQHFAQPTNASPLHPSKF